MRESQENWLSSVDKDYAFHVENGQYAAQRPAGESWDDPRRHHVEEIASRIIQENFGDLKPAYSEKWDETQFWANTVGGIFEPQLSVMHDKGKLLLSTMGPKDRQIKPDASDEEIETLVYKTLGIKPAKKKSVSSNEETKASVGDLQATLFPDNDSPSSDFRFGAGPDPFLSQVKPFPDEQTVRGEADDQPPQGKLPSFATLPGESKQVPGPEGQPQLAVVHGGERIGTPEPGPFGRALAPEVATDAARPRFPAEVPGSPFGQGANRAGDAAQLDTGQIDRLGDMLRSPPSASEVHWNRPDSGQPSKVDWQAVAEANQGGGGQEQPAPQQPPLPTFQAAEPLSPLDLPRPHVPSPEPQNQSWWRRFPEPHRLTQRASSRQMDEEANRLPQEEEEQAEEQTRAAFERVAQESPLYDRLKRRENLWQIKERSVEPTEITPPVDAPGTPVETPAEKAPETGKAPSYSSYARGLMFPKGRPEPAAPKFPREFQGTALAGSEPRRRKKVEPGSYLEELQGQLKNPRAPRPLRFPTGEKATGTAPFELPTEQRGTELDVGGESERAPKFPGGGDRMPSRGPFADTDTDAHFPEHPSLLPGSSDRMGSGKRGDDDSDMMSVLQKILTGIETLVRLQTQDQKSGGTGESKSETPAKYEPLTTVKTVKDASLFRKTAGKHWGKALYAGLSLLGG